MEYGGRMGVETDMGQETVFKTLHQYSRNPVPRADMEKLEAIAKDYCHVKNYVYQQYGGIGSLPKIYPGYTVQNEMTGSGLRARLGLPSVFFYCAIFDALGDIKSRWSHTKNKIEENIRKNPNLTPEDRHYLRFVMKQSQCFEAILLGKPIVLGQNWQESYDSIRAGVDERRLNQYLRRQVRKHTGKMRTDAADGFSMTAKAYRYGDNGGSHGIYISTKENRKRVFIPLTDSNRYSRQLFIRLYPREERIKIDVPVETKVKVMPGYRNEVGLAVGMTEMFVTDQGNVYGGRYGVYQTALTEYVQEGMTRYQKNKRNNPGRKKYNAGKAKLEDTLHTYVNGELNRMLETEKPGVIYIPKLPPTPKAGINGKINNAVNMWQRGYVRRRLAQKCRERAIELIEVFGKDISNECSECGSVGAKTKGVFTCEACGMQIPERINTARNVLNRGRAGKEQKAADAHAGGQDTSGTAK